MEENSNKRTKTEKRKQKFLNEAVKIGIYKHEVLNFLKYSSKSFLISNCMNSNQYTCLLLHFISATKFTILTI